jgi:hypothetical protein
MEKRASDAAESWDLQLSRSNGGMNFALEFSFGTTSEGETIQRADCSAAIALRNGEAAPTKRPLRQRMNQQASAFG